MQRTRTASALFAFTASLLVLPLTGAHAANPTRDLVDAAGRAEAPATARTLIDRALDHAAGGREVMAKAMLTELVSPRSSLTLTDDDREAAMDALVRVRTAVDALDPAEVRLQQAELAFRTGNLLRARQGAELVRDGRTARQGQRDRAAALVAEIEDQQDAFAERAPAVIADAVARFEAGQYAEAKRMLETVVRSGAELTDADRSLASSYQSRIVDLELLNDAQFDTGPVLLGSLGQDGDPDPRVDWLVGSSFQPAQNSDDPVMTGRQLDAMERMRQADNAYAEGRYNDAATRYRALLSEFRDVLTEDQRLAVEDRLTESEVLLRQPVNNQDDLLGDTIRETELRRAAARAEFENLMEQANAALESGETRDARSLVNQARLSLRNYRDALPEAEYEDRFATTDTLSDAIDTAEERQRINERNAIERQLEEEQARQAREEQESKDRRIAEFIDRIRALQAEQQYEEALGVVDQILFLDPRNPSGLLLRDVLEDTLIYTEAHRIQGRKSHSYAVQALENSRAMIAPDGIIEYPDDWRRISFLRGDAMAYSESSENRFVLDRLADTRVPANFEGDTLESVLDWVQQNADVDMDVNWRALASVGVERDAPIDLNLSLATIQSVLDRALEKASPNIDLGAAWAVNEGILIVSSDEALRRNTSLEIYDVRDLISVVPDHNDIPDFDLSRIVDRMTDRSVSSPFETSDPDADEGFGFSGRRELEPIDQLIDLIQANVDPRNWEQSGGDTGRIQEMNGALIVTQTPRNHRAIRGLLSQLRGIRSMQINVETRFLAVSENFFEQLGFDLDLYFGGNSNAYQIQSLVDPSLLPSDYIGLNGQVLSNNGNNGNVSGGGVFAQDTDGDGVADTFAPINQPIFNPNFLGDQYSIIGAPSNSLGITNLLVGASSFATDILNEGPALGLVGTFLDDVQVDFLVQATQADQRSVTLTAPRLTFTNGQRANISVTTQQSYIAQLTPVVSDSATAFQAVPAVVTDGVFLDVTGTISSDRRYVTLDISTGISTANLENERQIVGAAGGGGGGGGVGGGGGGAGGGAIAVGTIQLPTTQGTTVNTTVTVPDKGTALLGGQRLINEVEVESGVPVLSKIPFLSRFFTNRAEVTEEQTLLILVKPTILIQNEQENDAFPGLIDELRLGG